MVSLDAASACRGALATGVVIQCRPRNVDTSEVDVTVKLKVTDYTHFAKPPLGPLRLEEDIFSGIIHVHSRFTKCT